MKRIAAIATLLALAGCGATAPDAAPTASVQVGVVRPRQGMLPATVTAYGTVSPSTTGTETISVAQPGQVTRLMVTAGAAVRAGQPLATFVVAPDARSAYEQATSALAAARKQRASTAQLLAQQLATRDQLVQADKAVSDAQAALSALRANGAGAAVRTLAAPFAGIVTAIPVAQGDRTQAGAPLLTVARAGGIVVTVGVDAADRAKVIPGQPATIDRLAGGPTLAGRVIRVDSTVNAQSRLVDVDLSFPAGSLLPGEATKVAVATGQVAGWIVPHQAVVTAGGAPRVFQVAHGEKAKAVPVRILLASDQGDVVAGGVDPALPLIVAGAYQVSDGDPVRRGR